MSSMSNPASVSDTDRAIIVSMVTRLLKDKPQDPIPFMYSFLQQKRDGIAKPDMATNGEVANMKNLRKQYEYLKSQVNDGGKNSDETEESEEESDEEEKVEVKPRPIKQRKGVSAEVFGENNKKENFVAPVFEKTEAVKE